MKKVMRIIVVFMICIVGAKGAEYQDVILKIINESRVENGMKPLRVNEKLNDIAIVKAKDMAEEGNLSHTSKKYGITFNLIKEEGIKYSAAAENIARGHDTPEFVAHRWLKSKGHRENILNSEYEETGIGLAQDRDGKNYWVQLFIKKK